MNLKLKPVIACLSLLICADIAHAEASPEQSAANSQEQMTAAMQKIAEQTAQLQKQMVALQTEIHGLEKEEQKLKQHQLAMASTTGETQSHVQSPKKTASGEEVELPKPQPSDTLSTPTPPANTANTTDANKYDSAPYGHKVLANIGGTAVTTSPFLHSRSNFNDGSDLIVNYSSINKDVAALNQRADFSNQMQAVGLKQPSYPLLELSGEVEATAFGQRAFNGNHENDIDLTDAEIDMQALINPWFTGFMSFAYDNSPPGSGARINNSNVFLDQGFLTFGNFNKSPWYATAGQVYVPFGEYNSYLISDPINKTLFRTKARPLVIGYQSPGSTGVYASVYGFRGDSRTGHYDPTNEERAANDHINNYGGNLGYAFDLGALHTDIGVSYINNVTDSNGMQGTSAPDNQFQGFGDNSSTQVLLHKVPGVDARAMFALYDFNLISEYTTVTRSFDIRDLMYNNKAAKPRAVHVEGVYNFNFFGKPSNIALGYDKSWESLALNVPKERYSAGFNMSFWENTLASLELRHDINYSSSDVASGSMGTVFSPAGKHQNAITGEFDVYF